MATDCQLEFGHRTGLVFKPFVSNFATLLVRPRKSHPEPNRGHLIIKKAFGHIEERQQVSLTTMNLDLRDPLDISSLPDLKVDLDEAIENEIDDNEDVVVVTTPATPGIIELHNLWYTRNLGCIIGHRYDGLNIFFT